MDIVVSGSSGLIGSALVPALAAAGHRPIRLVRRPARGADEIFWNPAEEEIDSASLEGVGGVVHLAGAGIADQRWTDAYRSTIRDSRTIPTHVLSAAMAGLQRPPSVLLSGSAIGYYGAAGDDELTEASPNGTGFLAEVCRQWESSTVVAWNTSIRIAYLRTGVVLTPMGGALRKMLPLFRFGLGGRMGTGNQWWSWISLEDQVAAIVHLLTADVTGPVNLTAPAPVTNAEFTKTLGRVLRRPTIVPVPSFGPKLLLGRELADNLLFTGQRVLPKVLQDSGFTFGDPTLEGALRRTLGKPAS